MNTKIASTLVPLILALVTLTPGAQAAARESAGRVLIAAGEVHAVRGTTTVTLARGADVEVGDRIETGPDSNAQLRFSDASVVSLKPGTRFVVTDYSYHGAEDGSEHVLFDLIRGGLRTVTGVIGHLHHDSYQVRTPAATIGIRGTVWGATHCEADECKNDDGSIAKPGTYGEVKAGAIAVTTNATEADFGPSSAFYVASRDSAPTRLLVAPNFVSAVLQQRPIDSAQSDVATSATAAGGATGAAGAAGAGGAAGGGAANKAGTAVAATLNSALSTDSSATAAVASELAVVNSVTGTGATTLVTSIPLTYVASNNVTPSGASSALLPNISGVTAFIATYTVGLNGVDFIESCTGGGVCSGANSVSSYSFNGGQPISWSSTSGPALLVQTAPLGNSLVASLNSGQGQIFVGQLVGPYAGVTSSGGAFNGPGGFVYLATNSNLLNYSAPTSGSFSFGAPGVFIGLASDSAGNSGAVSSFSGSYNAGTRLFSFSTRVDFSSIAGFGAADFTISSSTTLAAGSNSVKSASLTATCSGGGCQASTVSGQWYGVMLNNSTNIAMMGVTGGLSNATRSLLGGNTVVFAAAGKCNAGAC